MLRLLKLLPLFFLLGADWSGNYIQQKDCYFGSSSGGRCYFSPTVSEATSILDVGVCENFDVVFNSDLLSTTHDTTIQIFSCAHPTADTNNCELLNDMTLDGDPKVGDFEILGAAAIWIFADATVSGGDTPRLIISCHPR